MEVCSDQSTSAPNHVSPSDEYSQSDRRMKYYNLAFTSTLEELNNKSFIKLQLKLIKMIVTTHKGAVFKVKTGPDNEADVDIFNDIDPLFNPPVKEVIIKGNEKNFISIHPVATTLSPHAMKKDPTIAKFLEENKFGLRRHHWFTNEVEVARPYYILTKDPKYMQPHDVIQQLDIPQELADEILAMDHRIVPTQLQQKKTKKIKKPKSTQQLQISRMQMALS